MCLGIRMRVVTTDGLAARCEAGGVMRPVSLFLLQDEPVSPGDYVLVHVGYAIGKVRAEDADLFDQALEAAEADDA